MKKNLTEIRKQALKIYQGFRDIKCPYFNNKVRFTSEGFNDIRYKKARKERHPKAQEIRYKLLKLAKQIIEKSHTWQEHYEYSKFVEIKINKRREKILKKFCVWGFIAIIKGIKIKILVQQIENGKPKFLSMIPNWRARKTKEGKTFINYTGDPLQD